MNTLSKKPFYSSITIIILPLLVFAANLSLAFSFGIEFVGANPIDKIFHVLGGASISLCVAGILSNLIRRKIVKIQDTVVFCLVIVGIVCFAVICWELCEYILIFPFWPETFSYADTIIDMTLGLVGGLLPLFFVWRPFEKYDLPLQGNSIE